MSYYKHYPTTEILKNCLLSCSISRERKTYDVGDMTYGDHVS